MSSRAGTKRKMEEDEDENSSGESSEQSEEDADGVGEDDNSSDQESSENSGGEYTSRNIKGTAVTVDTDLLNCTVCFLPLRPPLFQCWNGHIACLSCCDKLQRKCPTCKKNNKFSRCIAFEKLIESIRVPCSNNGCKKKIPYSDLRKHQEDTCTHAPCFCPIPNCSFSGSIGLLSAHVEDCHYDAVEHLNEFDSTISIERNKLLYVIRFGNYKEVFLLVNRVVTSGNALSMTCISPQTSKFKYDLELYNCGVRYLSMTAPMTTGLEKWTEPTYPDDFSLLVPGKFSEHGFITLSIDIKKEHV